MTKKQKSSQAEIFLNSLQSYIYEPDIEPENRALREISGQVLYFAFLLAALPRKTQKLLAIGSKNLNILRDSQVVALLKHLNLQGE